MKVSIQACDIAPGEVCLVELPDETTVSLTYAQSEIVIPLPDGDALVSITASAPLENLTMPIKPSDPAAPTPVAPDATPST